jgi:hypothetical protein
VSSWLLGCCFPYSQSNSEGASILYLRVASVFILENAFPSKSFASVHEALSNAYLEKKVPNKTTIMMSTASLQIML